MDDAHNKSDKDEQNSRASAFIKRWQSPPASELSIAQSFVRELWLGYMDFPRIDVRGRLLKSG